MRLRLPARRSSPCAQHTIRLPRPPWRRRSACPRYRDHRSRGTVCLGGYCRIGLYAIAYERTIMPSRRS